MTTAVNVSALIYARKLTGMTQAELAKKIGYSRFMVNILENHGRGSDRLIVRYAKAVKVPVRSVLLRKNGE